jgi:hypothetical protein
MKVNWKMKGLAKGVDPLQANEEIQRLQNIYGNITPEIIVNEASNPDNILHKIFEWDNEKAGYHYRLQQARILLNNIQVTIISDGEKLNIDVYEVTTRSEGYKSIDTFDANDIKYVRENTLMQLKYLKNKIAVYKEFNKVVEYLEMAIEVV